MFFVQLKLAAQVKRSTTQFRALCGSSTDDQHGLLTTTLKTQDYISYLRDAVFRQEITFFIENPPHVHHFDQFCIVWFSRYHMVLVLCIINIVMLYAVKLISI